MNHQFLVECRNRRWFLGSLISGCLAAVSGCSSDGHFELFGYSTRSRFPDDIKTVYVPIFKNKAFQTTPFRGLEKQLTLAVLKELQNAGLRIQSDKTRADTELLGTVISINKNIQNRTQQNEVREGEVQPGVEIVWRDLRTGKVLTNPVKPVGVASPDDLPAFDPDNQPLKSGWDEAIPVQLTATGRFLPEVGESVATAEQRVCYKLAKDIVSMMERSWTPKTRTPPPGPIN